MFPSLSSILPHVTNPRRSHRILRTLPGVTPRVMYEVVKDVSSYSLFVPFISRSVVVPGSVSLGPPLDRNPSSAPSSSFPSYESFKATVTVDFLSSLLSSAAVPLPLGVQSSLVESYTSDVKCTVSSFSSSSVSSSPSPSPPSSFGFQSSLLKPVLLRSSLSSSSPPPSSHRYTVSSTALDSSTFTHLTSHWVLSPSVVPVGGTSLTFDVAYQVSTSAGPILDYAVASTFSALAERQADAFVKRGEEANRRANATRY